MVDVFISYTRDDKAVAQALHDFLTAEGWEVWFDPEIYAGARWEDLLLDTLRDAKAANAVFHATGIRVRKVPITPEMLV